jgi:CheY-like chemotaxis protein
MKSTLEILLVEDNDGDVAMTELALQNEADPCNLSVANDGIEALDHLHKRGEFTNAVIPHLILLDLNMPRMNGKELLAALKADEQFKRIPIVVLTSSQATSDIWESYELNANSYVVKPFEGLIFMDAVRQIVNYWKNLAQLPYEVSADQS